MKKFFEKITEIVKGTTKTKPKIAPKKEKAEAAKPAQKTPTAKAQAKVAPKVKPVIKKTAKLAQELGTGEKAVVKPSITDLKKELIEELIEKGKRANFLTYEEVMEFGDKNHLTEPETNEFCAHWKKNTLNLSCKKNLKAKQLSLMA